MRFGKVSHALFTAAALTYGTAAFAGGSIDMDDPRRVVGRENDVRVDAQLFQDTVSPGAPVGVTYQIFNASTAPVAVADKVASASYDADSATITLSVGAEVPVDGRMPHVVLIAPGEKKVFRSGATPAFNVGALRATSPDLPRFVQVKVTILRNLEPFLELIAKQQPKRGPMLTDAQFDLWFESNDTIFLNTVPVRFSPRTASSSYSADQRAASARF